MLPRTRSLACSVPSRLVPGAKASISDSGKSANSSSRSRRGGVKLVDGGRPRDAVRGQGGVDLGGRHGLVNGAAQIEGADGQRVDAKIAALHPYCHTAVGGAVVSGDLG